MRKWLSLAELVPLLLQFAVPFLGFLLSSEGILGLIDVALHRVNAVLRRVHWLDRFEGGSGELI